MHSVPDISPDPREAFGVLARDFSLEALAEGPVAPLMREALRSCGRFSQRASPLQPLFVLWLLLCRPLYAGDSWSALFQRLAHALRGRIAGLDDRTVTDGALCHARERLGPEPLVRLLGSLADASPAGPRFHGLRLLALDGVRLDVPDTAGNETAFGRRGGGRGPSAWPQVLVMVLADVATRIPRAARLGPCRAAEKVLARDLLPGLGEGDLLLLDAGFYGVPFLGAVAARGACYVCPVPRHVVFRRQGLVRTEGEFRDYTASMRCRRPLPDGRTRTEWMEVRVVEWHRPGFRPPRFVTNLPPSVPAAEVVGVYGRRWEIETAFDEIKTVLCHAPAGAPPTELRSKTPALIHQEVFALLGAYSLIRRTIAQAADRADLAPTAISFTGALRCIALAAIAMLAAPGSHLPMLFSRMLEDIARQRLRRPPRPRSYPRATKRKAPKYSLRKAAA